MTLNVFIDGAEGTTGLEIHDRLVARDGVEVIRLDDAVRKVASRRVEAARAADIAILCLPDAAAVEMVAALEGTDTRIIDASSAHRTAPDWTYGFAELRLRQRDAIRNARLVSNPGCYPTGFLALMAPLVERGLLPADANYAVHAVSGYSGGGKALIARFADEPNIGFRSYGLSLDHKHLPEMQAHAGLARAPVFAPAVAPVYRGMIVEVPLDLAALGVRDADLLTAALVERFADEPGVRVAELSEEDAPAELLLRADSPPTDRLTLHVFANEARARLIATLDNLGKGAAGAAVQNLNIMAGLPETAGLRLD